jgi:hypothetical protein
MSAVLAAAAAAGRLAEIRRQGSGLLLIGSGSFARNSEGSYLTDAATIAWAGVNARRAEDRGDGFAGTLLEGARGNEIRNSNDVTSPTAGWGIDAGLLRAMVAGSAPDGSTSVGEATVDTTGTFRRLHNTVATSYTAGVNSAWVRKVVGDKFTCAIAAAGGTAENQTTTALASAWTRFSARATGSTGATTAILAAPANPESFSSATAGDAFQIAHVQFERNARWPSSYIRTTGAAVERAADVWLFEPSAVEPRLLTGRSQVRVSPQWGTADLVSGHEAWIYGIDSVFNGLRFARGSTGLRVEAIEDDTVRAASNYLTFPRHAILTITVDPVAATIHVAGATAGDGTGSAGTAWTWPCVEGLRLGGVWDDSGRELYGRVSVPVAADDVADLVGLAGFTGTVRAESAVDAGILGDNTTGFWVGVLVDFGSLGGAGDRVWAARGNGGGDGHGWAFFDSGNQFFARMGAVTAAVPTPVLNLTSGSYPSRAGKLQAALFFFDKANERVRLWFSGDQIGTQNTATQYGTGGSRRMLLGNRALADMPASNATPIGLVGGDGYVPTDSEITAWFAGIKAAGDVVAIPGKTTGRWSVRDSADPTATVQATVGSADLTVVGSVTRTELSSWEWGW